MDERAIASKISEIVCGLKYYEWCKIRHAIERKYASASNKVVLEDTEALAKAVLYELKDYSDTT